VRSSFDLPACVVEHAHRGTHDGQEQGFACQTCHDGLMGSYELVAGKPVFKG